MDVHVGLQYPVLPELLYLWYPMTDCAVRTVCTYYSIYVLLYCKCKAIRTYVRIYITNELSKIGDTRDYIVPDKIVHRSR